MPVVRYERPRPGDLLHLDIKKLPRIHRPGFRVIGNPRDTAAGAGYDFVFVAIDDHSRLGVTLREVKTDNGACFCSLLFAQACRELGLKHLFTRPYTPRTNGKAERFIQSSLREWAYASTFSSSAHRTGHLSRWLHRYNWHRPRYSLGLLPPISRLRLSMNNLLKHHR